MAGIVHSNIVHNQLEHGECCEQRVDDDQENGCSPTLLLTVGDDHSSHPHQLLEYECKRNGSEYQRDVTKCKLNRSMNLDRVLRDTSQDDIDG